MSHLFVDISSHGLGHLAQIAPILNSLVIQRPDTQLTIRSGLKRSQLNARISPKFTHIEGCSDFGFLMQDATRIDYNATAKAYQQFHSDWKNKVAEEVEFLKSLDIRAVLTDVAYLPLTAAQRLGLPSAAISSLNWADLFQHIYGKEAWAPPIHSEILHAYQQADSFLRLTPAMPMPNLTNSVAIPPVSKTGSDKRDTLRKYIQATRHAPLEQEAILILVAFGGFSKELNCSRFISAQNVFWIVPSANDCPSHRDDFLSLDDLAIEFTDLLKSVDAIVTKPGYGTFTEAVHNQTAILYFKRDQWPEQDCLIEWAHQHGIAHPIDENTLYTNRLMEVLKPLLSSNRPIPPAMNGHLTAANWIARWLNRV